MSSYSDDDAFEAAAAPRPSLSQQAMGARFGASGATYLEGLNPAQRQAVETLDGPVLMLAGAGTGKTKALTCRIAHLMATGRARPNEILAVTFTNKAAREMKNRVAGLTGHIEGMPWLGTFHAICVKLLRRHAELIGLKSSFTILDTDDQLRLLKQLVSASNIDDKRWPARMLAGIIDGWKNKAWTPSQVPVSESSAYDGKGVELYAAYQQRLKDLNACDFGDLLLHMVTIFQTHDDVLKQYQRWFKYILVDEYQDTNVAQYLWLRLLAQGHKNICCVGDDDQSIYGWRGAEVGNILRFEKDFEGAHVVRLEQNYRSTGHILGAAAGVIEANKGRLGKTLWTAATGGESVRLSGNWDGDEEARWIGEEIEALSSGSSAIAKRRENSRTEQLRKLVREYDEGGRLAGLNRVEDLVERLKTDATFLADENHKALLWEVATRLDGGLSIEPALQKFWLNEMAILVRASHQMRAFEDRFLTIGLPYRVIGGPRFYERMEIRDAMAYFRLAVSQDDDLAFERIVNTPKRGLGDKAVQTIQMTARSNGVNLVEGARICVEAGLIKGKGGNALRELVHGLDRWHAQLRAEADTHVELAEMILDESGYTGFWQNDKTPEAPGRLENLKELVKALENFDNLQGFLEHVSLIMDNAQDEEDDKVTIMTLHAAKGLEYPAVFLPGWEDGLFPSQRSMDESGLKGLEEERRLAYVGITRAEELCTISFAANRRVYGQWQSQMPSRFIDELPPDHIEVLTPPGLYGGGYGAAGMTGGMSTQANPASAGFTSNLHDKAAEANVYNSPGWKRLQARSQQRPTSQPKETRNMVIDMTASSSFTTGDRVFHQKFGYGEVMEIEGDKLVIEFDKAGEKKVVAKFVVGAAQANDVPF